MPLNGFVNEPWSEQVVFVSVHSSLAKLTSAETLVLYDKTDSEVDGDKKGWFFPGVTTLFFICRLIILEENIVVILFENRRFRQNGKPYV